MFGEKSEMANQHKRRARKAVLLTSTIFVGYCSGSVDGRPISTRNVNRYSKTLVRIKGPRLHPCPCFAGLDLSYSRSDSDSDRTFSSFQGHGRHPHPHPCHDHFRTSKMYGTSSTICRMRNGNNRAKIKVPFTNSYMSKLKSHHDMHGTESTSASASEWKAGDWEADLQSLEASVALLNAPTQLAQSERMALLDEFARQRRDLFPDLLRFVVKPCLLALAMVMVTMSARSANINRSAISASVSASSSTSLSVMKLVPVIIIIFSKIMNLAFWSISVGGPLMTHLYHKSKQNIKNLPKKRKSEWESEYIDPRLDCSNDSLCLLENWAFAVYPSALLGCITLLLKISLRMGAQTSSWTSTLVSASLWDPKSGVQMWRFATILSQCLTRLGAAAAIHQFPVYLYNLRRERTKGPEPKLQSLLKGWIDMSLWILPWGFASDVGQVYGAAIRSGVRVGWKQRSTFGFGYPGVHVAAGTGIMIATALAHAALMASIMMQVYQFIAFQRLVRVGQFTKISLATSPTVLKQLMEHAGQSEGTTDAKTDHGDPFETKWRYRLRWREPKRLFSSFRQMARDFTIFFFTGWGEDASLAQVESKRMPHLLKLVQKEMEGGSGARTGNPENQSRYPKRDTWIPNATKSISKIHQENYEKKTFEDPLGIALQQTFGIGLSLDFDHSSKLNEGEAPSVHRLRARAVKSAIKRYNEIPDIVRAEFDQIYRIQSEGGIDNIEGGDDNDGTNNGNNYLKEDGDMVRKALEEKRVTEERLELKKSVVQLLSLIPTNAPAPGGKPLDVLSMRQSDVDSLSGVANLPFLQDADDDDDFGSDFIVKDPYLGDDIFSDEDNVFV